MPKLRITIELDYDAKDMYGDDPKGKEWFMVDVLFKNKLELYSYEVDDFIGNVKVLETSPVPEPPFEDRKE